MNKENKDFRFVLIDDDPSYNKIMKRVAEVEGVHLDIYSSLSDLGSMSLLSRYDVAIVDYNLEHMTGLEIGEYLNTFFSNIPMILISASMSLEGGDRWPDSVVSFIPKSAGYLHVIEEALEIVRKRNKYLWTFHADGIAVGDYQI